MAEAGPEAQPSAFYALHPNWGGLRLRLEDRGITLDAAGLHFTRYRRPMFRPYSSIVAVNLALVSLPRMPDVAQMFITFADGLVMRLQDTNDWGNKDPDMTQVYYRFKADLHERLIASGADRAIRFQVGMPSNRRGFLKFALVLAAGFFLGLPLVILFMTRRLEVLPVMLAGLAFTYPLFRSASRNDGRTYNPYNPPDMLA